MGGAHETSVGRRLKVASRSLAHAVGQGIEHAVSSHHRRRLRKAGWEHAFDADELGFSTGATFEPRAGSRVEVLVDGSAYLPAVAEAIAGAKSHVHLLGWCFSPELNLTRE